jgi:hypothetical protein
VTIVLYLRQRVRKDLTYRTSVTSLVSVHPDARDEITIFVEGKRIARRVHLVRIELTNLGADIPEGDFQRERDSQRRTPIRIPLGEDAHVLGRPQIEEKDPTDLHPVVQAQGSSLVLHPLLLNRGDRFTIAAKVENLAGPLHPESRITGLPRLREIRPEGTESAAKFYVRRFTLMLALVVVLGVSAAGVSAEFTSLTTLRTRVEFVDGRTICGNVTVKGGVVSIERDERHDEFRLSDVREIRDRAC